jgi:hypothetical protein
MASANSGDIKATFDKYAKFGKTEAQLKELKGALRIESRNIQKMLKETGVIDSKYTSNLLDNDISKPVWPLSDSRLRLLLWSRISVRVIGKLTTSMAAEYPKGT